MGLGKTGQSAVLSLLQAGVEVWAWDDSEDQRYEAQMAGIPLMDLNRAALRSLNFIIWSPGIPHSFPTPHPVAVRAVESQVPIVCDIDVLCQVQHHADFIGITGTNGKSTTTALIAHILTQFRPTEVGGNIGFPALNLEPLGKEGTYVLELSSYQTELTPSFAPVAAVLLNITPDHLARHGGFDGYVAAKTKIFAHHAIQERKPVAVICIDTEPCLKIAEDLRRENIWQVIPVSTKAILEEGVFVEDGMLYEVRSGEAILIADLKKIETLKGQHNHENAACAYAVLRHTYGFEPRHIVKAMSSFGGLAHRQYLVRAINGVPYINDSKATNADATEKALLCFRRIYWILGGQPKEGGLNGLEPHMDRVEKAYLIGEAAPQFAQWLEKNNITYEHCGTLDVAVAAAHYDAQAGIHTPDFRGAGVVLLSPACASWDQFRSFEHRGDVFTQLVQNLEEK